MEVIEKTIDKHKMAVGKIKYVEKLINDSYPKIKIDCGDIHILNLLTHDNYLENVKILAANVLNKEYNKGILLSHNTVHVGDGTVQCRPGSNRSLGDIYMIVKYYIPELTLLDLIGAIHELCTSKFYFASFICPDIERRVYILNKSHHSYGYLRASGLSEDMTCKEDYNDYLKFPHDYIIAEDEFELTWFDFLDALNIDINEII